MEPWREELYHHGVLGQKWGQRFGPPYPLNAAAKARKRKGLGPDSSDNNSKVKDIKTGPGGGGGGGASEEDKEKEELIKRIAEMTGMKESEIRKLIDIRDNGTVNGKMDGKTGIYYEKMLLGLAEGDARLSNQIDNAINSYLKNKKKKQAVDALSKRTTKEDVDPISKVKEKIDKSVKDTSNKVSKAVNDAKKKASETADKIESKAKETYNDAVDKINKGVQDTKNKAANSNVVKYFNGDLEREEIRKAIANLKVASEAQDLRNQRKDAENARKLKTAEEDKKKAEAKQEAQKKEDINKKVQQAVLDSYSKTNPNNTDLSTLAPKRNYSKHDVAQAFNIVYDGIKKDGGDAVSFVGKGSDKEFEKYLKSKGVNPKDFTNVELGKLRSYIEYPDLYFRTLQHSSSYELYHHGTDGMKWGTRNGPPYPLYRQSKFRFKLTDRRKAQVRSEERARRKKAQAVKRAERRAANEERTAKKREEKQQIKARRAAKSILAPVVPAPLIPKAARYPNKVQSDSNRKNVKNMSDQELNNAIKRLENEKRYLELSGREVSQGKLFMENMMEKVGTQTINSFVTSFATNVGTQLGKKVSDEMFENMKSDKK